MLASALWGDIGDGAFEHFEERLLDAFAGDIAGDRDIARRLADFVELVDVDDASLGCFDIEVGSLEEFEEQVFDIFADIACFGECGCIADGEGDLEHACHGFGEEGFA